LVFTLQTVFRN